MHVDESEGDERERDERKGDERCTIFGPAAARLSRTRMSRTRQREWRWNWRGAVIGNNTYVLAIMAKNPARKDLRSKN